MQARKELHQKNKRLKFKREKSTGEQSGKDNEE